MGIFVPEGDGTITNSFGAFFRRGDFVTVKVNAAGTTATVISAPHVQEALNPYRFKSEPQTYTNGGLITLQHFLPETPTVFAAAIRCLTAEQGYLVGQVINVSTPLFIGSTGDRAQVNMYADATNLYTQVGANGFRPMAVGGSGVSNTFNPANWELIVSAEVV